MVFNVMDWQKDTSDALYEKIHPTQKPLPVLERLITLFTDPGDIVIDPVAGSGATIVAAENCGRQGIGFEIKKDYHAKANAWIQRHRQVRQEMTHQGFSPTLLAAQHPDQPVLFPVDPNHEHIALEPE